MTRLLRSISLVLPASVLLLSCGHFSTNSPAPELSKDQGDKMPSLPGYVLKREGGAKRVLILVHGLGGDGKSSWTSANRTYWPDLMEKDLVFSDFDIYVYQYESSLFGGCLPVTDVANNLRIHLKNDDVLGSHGQVVFLAHSQGGLVVRQFLLRNREEVGKIPLVMFFATPTGGSERADDASLLPTCSQVDDLRSIDVNSYLKSQLSDWLSSGFPEKIVSRCAFETRKYLGSLTVEQSSAALLCSKDPEALPTNHSDAVKPNGSSDLSHIIVRNAIRDLPSPGLSAASPPHDKSELQKQNLNLQDRLDQRYRNRSVREALGRFLKEGDGLLQTLFIRPPQPIPEKEANGWYTRVRKYLSDHLDSSYEARFVTPDFGLSMSYGLPEEHEKFITGIKARMSALRRFIEELRD
jgi:hypothetical protein